jgi:site-specific recombinase XerD
MTTGGAAQARQLLEDFAWSTWTIGSRSTQWKAYLEFCGHEGRAIVPVNEVQLVAYVGWLAIEREAGRRSVSAASLSQYISAVRVVAKLFFDGKEALTAGRMPILQAFLRAYGQWEARSLPRLTHRNGVPADIIQAIWANAMQSEDRVVIRDAAAVILAYVQGLRESSVMSLPAENITHTAAKMTVRLVLVKGKELRHAVLATYARTGVATLPSPIDLL